MHNLPSRAFMSQLVIIISLVAMLVFYHKAHLDFSYWGWWVLAVAFFCLGVPHGAFDFDLYQRNERPSLQQLVQFLVSYVAIASVMFLLWLALPVLCFAAFMIISVWHFRTDWVTYCQPSYSLCLALFVICAPSVFAYPETQQYLQWLYLTEFWAMAMIILMQLCFIAASLVMCIGLLRKKVAPNLLLCLEMVALIAVLKTTSVLVYFMVYFISLHSLWYYVRYCRRYQLHPRQLVKKSSPWVLLTMVFAAVVYALWGKNIEQGVLVLMFIGLFALTVPHMILVERAINRNAT